MKAKWELEGYANERAYLTAIRRSLNSDKMFYLKDRKCPDRDKALRELGERIRRVDNMLKTM